MKKIVHLALIIVLITSCVVKHPSTKTTATVAVTATKDTIRGTRSLNLLYRDTDKLIFTIKQNTIGPVKGDQVKIDLIFTNKSHQNVRILDMFDDLKTNFSVVLKPKNGGTRMPLSSGLTQFYEGYKFKYLTVLRGKSITKTIDLSSALRKKNFIMSPNIYNVYFIYRNIYGQNCITGKFESNDINLEVVQ